MAMPESVALHTERLRVRELALDDVPAFLAFASDPEVVRHLSFSPTSEAEARALIATAIDAQASDPRTTYALAIEERSTGTLVGSCGLDVAVGPSNVAELYYVLRRESWGRGYATEAARAVLEFGFGQLRLHRIWAHASPDNPASSRVMEKAGMAYEGRVRGVMLRDGRWHDAFQYAILEGDPRR